MNNRSKALYTALAISSLVFAFSWLPIPRLFDVACILLILLFVPATMAPGNHELRKDPLILLGMCFFLYIVISIIWHRLTLPDNFPPTTSDRRFLRVLYFIAIAYAISRSGWLRAWHLLAVAFSGLVIYLVISFDQAEWVRAWHGERVDFGIHNAQHTGIVFSTCALALSVFTHRFYLWIKHVPRLTASLCVAFWVSAWLFSVWGVFVSQTRAVWLGLCVTLVLLPAILGLAYLLRGRPQFSMRKPLLVSMVSVALLVLLASSLNLPTLVSERLESENVTWESLRQAAAHEEQDLSSIEIRVASWAAATGWIMEKPFMGWGGRGSRPLIRNSDLFSDAFKKQFNHLHSSYFQTLVEIGMIGAMFIAVLMMLIGRATINAYQQRRMPLDVFLFAWIFFVFWLVVSFFESYVIYPSGTYLVAIVTSFFYSYCIRQTTYPA
ncbi:hypothetical protein DHB74_09385 [Pseudomonas sp. G11-1]|nr:hypothetical protein [Pseudomonas sp. G11-1]MCO5789786.1 hypothetical protein [Pseudomonas sp. G11-2]